MIRPNIYKYLIRIPNTNYILIVPHRNGSSAISHAIENNWMHSSLQYMDTTLLPDGFDHCYRDIFNFITFCACFNKKEYEQYKFFVPVRSPLSHLKSITELNRKEFIHKKEWFLDSDTLKTITEEELDKFSTIFALGVYFGINNFGKENKWGSYFFKYDHGCPSFLRASLLAAVGLNVTPLDMDSNEFSDFVNSNLLCSSDYKIEEALGFTPLKRSSNHGVVFDTLKSSSGNNNNELNDYIEHLNDLYGMFNDMLDKNTGIKIIEKVSAMYIEKNWHEEFMPNISDLIALGMLDNYDDVVNKLASSLLVSRKEKVDLARNFDLKWVNLYV